MLTYLYSWTFAKCYSRQSHIMACGSCAKGSSSGKSIYIHLLPGNKLEVEVLVVCFGI